MSKVNAECLGCARYKKPCVGHRNEMPCNIFKAKPREELNDECKICAWYGSNCVGKSDQIDCKTFAVSRIHTVAEFKKIIAERGYTHETLANELGITKSTFNLKANRSGTTSTKRFEFSKAEFLALSKILGFEICGLV